jgi:hypothetical protein
MTMTLSFRSRGEIIEIYKKMEEKAGEIEFEVSKIKK